MAKKTETFVTTTGSTTTTSTSSSTAGAMDILISTFYSYGSEKDLANIERAVYSHIQAVRTLGREQINTAEIADALSLPQELVIAAVNRLRDKGVRIAR